MITWDLPASSTPPVVCQPVLLFSLRPIYCCHSKSAKVCSWSKIHTLKGFKFFLQRFCGMFLVLEHVFPLSVEVLPAFAEQGPRSSQDQVVWFSTLMTFLSRLSPFFAILVQRKWVSKSWDKESRNGTFKLLLAYGKFFLWNSRNTISL